MHNFPERSMIRASTFLLALLVLTGADLSAQRRQLSLELNPVHGTLGYGWNVAPTRLVGVEVGFGFPQLDRTLAPADESFIDFLHVGGFVRSNPTKSVALDGHVQFGLAELRGCSGCLPGVFTAVSGAAFFGSRHLKVGPRLTAGVIKEDGNPSSFVLNLTPVAVLLSYTW
jgi:hypothetical protein